MMQSFGAWNETAAVALANLQKEGRVYSSAAAIKLIDFLSIQRVNFETDVRSYAAEKLGQSETRDFVMTTLGHVTTAVHGGGSVPDPGGWYFHDSRTGTYVLDRGFSAAWRELRKL
jgi:hypothetical protein